jgi:hypothetical protein
LLAGERLLSFLNKNRQDKFNMQSTFAFGRLLNEGWLEIDDFEGQDEDKITKIKLLTTIG